MKRKIGIVLSLLIVVCSWSNSQVVSRAKLRIALSATVLKIDTIFVYRYQITNNIASEQRLDELDLEVGDTETNKGGTLLKVAVPNDWSNWLSDNTALPKDPAAVATLICLASDSISNYAQLMIPAGSSIAPGDSMSISFESRGLPSIKRFWARGWTRPITESGYDSLKAFGVSDDEIMKPWYDDSYKGLTLSSQLPKNVFRSLLLLDTLISYKHQAVALGWLRDRKEDQKDEDDEEKEDGVVAKLDKRLEKARAELVKGDSIKARKELEKFVKKVEKLYKESDEEEDKDKPEKVVITSEGFALLKYNAEYLIDRLPKKQKGGKE